MQASNNRVIAVAIILMLAVAAPLTRAGKVLIQGAYLLSRSTGVNRIKGGSVQIN